jgi:hypothetical protein
VGILAEKPAAELTAACHDPSNFPGAPSTAKSAIFEMMLQVIYLLSQDRQYPYQDSDPSFPRHSFWCCVEKCSAKQEIHFVGIAGVRALAELFPPVGFYC